MRNLAFGTLEDEISNFYIIGIIITPAPFLNFTPCCLVVIQPFPAPSLGPRFRTHVAGNHYSLKAALVPTSSY